MERLIQLLTWANIRTPGCGTGEEWQSLVSLGLVRPYNQSAPELTEEGRRVFEVLKSSEVACPA